MAMTHEEAVKIFKRNSSTKQQLRNALGAALGIAAEEAERLEQMEQSLFNLCKEAFMRVYTDKTGLVYYFTGKDAKALTEIIKKIELMPSNTDTEASFKVIVERLPLWYINNAFNLTAISSRFNDIVLQIKNSKNGRATNNISNDYKQQLLSDLQS